jgi:hypothetical protein
MWRALLGDYAVPEKPSKSRKLRNAALAIGGFSAAAMAGLAATKRSRGPEWMQNGSEEPYATAAQPGSAATGTTSPKPTATNTRASSPSSTSASRGSGSGPQQRTNRQASDDKAGASPDEAIADTAETKFGTD